MAGLNDPKSLAAAAYNAAADCYDDPALSFWDRFGGRTVDRLGLTPGATVLDVCCGSGASVIPAAEWVGSTGRIVAVDMSEQLIALARAKCAARGLHHVEFRVGDVETLKLPAGSFDAVICVFGIFYTPDMARAIRELWRMVRPGGQLAITTWGQKLFEPGNSAYWEAIRAERPDLHKSSNPWDTINDAASLKQLLRRSGVETTDVEYESGEHPLGSPEDWWTIVMGSGYRGTADKLDPAARERVREATLRPLREKNVRAIRADVVYAVARKPGG